MQEYICPRCGQLSEFDAINGAASCPACGYRPGVIPSGPDDEWVERWQADAAGWTNHQQFLHDFLAFCARNHTPDAQVRVPPDSIAGALYRHYHGVMGEDNVLVAVTGSDARYRRRQVVRAFEGPTIIRAYYLLRMGRYDTAEHVLRDLVRRAPESPDALIWLAAAIEDPDEQRRCTERAFLLEPTHPLVRDAQAVLAGRVSMEEATRPAGGDEVRQTDCPQCGGALYFPPGAAEVACPYCGRTVPLPDGRMVDTRAAVLDDLRLERRVKGRRWEQAERVLRCQSCGAGLIMTRHLARRCLYCGSTHVLLETNAQSLEAPDGVLPFLLDERAARECVTHAGGGLLAGLVARFVGRQQAAELVDTFIPFWAFEGYVEVRSWDERETLVRVNTRLVGPLLLPAVREPPAELLGALLPYDVDKALVYDGDMMAGRDVALYTEDVESVAVMAYAAMVACARRAQKATDELEQELEAIGRERERKPRRLHHTFHVTGSTYRLLLLPVWLGWAYGPQGARKRIAVNGRNGRTEME